MHARTHARTHTHTHLPAYRPHSTTHWTHLPQVRLGRLHTTTVPQINPGYLSIFSSSFCLLSPALSDAVGWLDGCPNPPTWKKPTSPSASQQSAHRRRPRRCSPQTIHTYSVHTTSITMPQSVKGALRRRSTTSHFVWVAVRNDSRGRARAATLRQGATTGPKGNFVSASPAPMSLDGTLPETFFTGRR